MVMCATPCNYDEEYTKRNIICFNGASRSTHIEVIDSIIWNCFFDFSLSPLVSLGVVLGASRIKNPSIYSMQLALTRIN